MFKAGMKKEALLFIRSFRLWGVLLALCLFAIVDPLLMRGIQFFAQNVNVEAMGEVTTSLGSFNGIDGMYAIVTALADMRGTGILICMLVMMGTAGGELKKRATIIPNCSGLTPQAYLLPKFVFYPIFIFAATILAGLLSIAVSAVAFGGAFDMAALMGGFLLNSLYMVFLIVVYLCVGLSTARAGIAVAVLYCSSTILQLFFMGFGIDKYQPFALVSESSQLISGGQTDALDITVSVVVTLLLCVICYFVTLLALTAKRVDNIGGDKAEL